MLRFILADLRRMWPGAVVVVTLTALAVALGAAVTLQERALRLGSARASDKFDLVIGAPGSETQLVLSTVFLQPAALPLAPGGMLRDLSRDPRVAWAAPVGFGDFYKGYPVIGVTTALLAGASDGLASGRPFAAEGEAVIGSAVRLPEGQPITPMHGEARLGGHAHEKVAYRVSGRMEPTGTPWDRAILVPIQAVWHTHGLGAEEEDSHGNSNGAAHDHDEAEHAEHAFQADRPLNEDWNRADLPGLPAILVKPKSVSDAYRLRQEYRQRPDATAVFPGEVLTALYAMMGDARMALSAMARATQALVGAALLMVAVIHVGQRRRQIGALRAFGAPAGAIFAVVWGELAAILVAGAALGLAIGYGAAVAMSQAFAARQGFPLPVAFAREDAAGLALLFGAALLIPLIPALAAWRQSPLAALRG